MITKIDSFQSVRLHALRLSDIFYSGVIIAFTALAATLANFSTSLTLNRCKQASA